MIAKKLVIFYLLSLFGLQIVGCNGQVLENVRKVTYPPDFNYISKTKLTNTMQQFAWYSTLLDKNLQSAPDINEQQRLNAIDILQKMESLALNLGTEKLSSNHSIVSHNIDKFRNKIRLAKADLQSTPPSYYAAGSVSAYCLSCHAVINQN